MTNIDTNTDSVEELGKWHEADAEHYFTQGAWHLMSAAKDTAATLRALAAERDHLAAKVERMREALEIIAGQRQCIDNLMGNDDIARAALAGDK